MAEPSQANIDKMWAYARKYAEKSGTSLHPDVSVTEAVVQGLAKHIEEVGGRSAPATSIRTRRPRPSCAAGSARATRCRSGSTVTACSSSPRRACRSPSTCPRTTRAGTRMASSRTRHPTRAAPPPKCSSGSRRRAHEAAHRQEIRVPGMPEPISHFTHVVRAGRLVFVSGCVASDESGKTVGGGDIVAQRARCTRTSSAVWPPPAGRSPTSAR